MARQSAWSRLEMEVVDRHVEKLEKGRYRSGVEAARACHKALLALPDSQPRVRRTAMAVETIIKKRKRLAGVFAPGNSLAAVSQDCHRELTRLRTSRDCPHPKPVVRTRRGVYVRLGRAARKLRLTWPHHWWRPEERRVARRYARAYLAGRYPSLHVAARACQSELARGSNRPRQFHGIRWTLTNEARSMGMPRLTAAWSPAENRILNRYLRLLFERRGYCATEAARDCHRALGGSRSYNAVLVVLRTRAARVGLPRSHSYLTGEELRVAERYALKVHNGLLPSWWAAAQQCHTDLQSRTARAGRASKLGLRRATTHTFDTIRRAISRIAHSRNLHGPRKPHWSETEDRLVKGWVNWYDRYRHAQRLRPLKQAAEGLSEQLDEAEFHRTVSACKSRLILLWRQQHGAA
jgi:hypothetical protein